MKHKKKILKKIAGPKISPLRCEKNPNFEKFSKTTSDEKSRISEVENEKHISVPGGGGVYTRLKILLDFGFVFRFSKIWTIDEIKNLSNVVNIARGTKNFH